MRVGHFDCFSGVSGDMMLAALVGAGVDPARILDGIASLRLPIRAAFEPVKKGGLAAIAARIDAEQEHVHRGIGEIEAILDRGRLPPQALVLAKHVFRRLAEAEAAVHGVAVEQVHFHEVGALDSIADIVGASIGLDALQLDHVTAGPVAVGSGMVQTAHGLLPVPAPATALLLTGVPLARTSIKAELTTPTGAAMLTSIVHEWVDSPAMRIERIGIGAGSRDLLEQPNVLRLFVGTAEENPAADAANATWDDEIWLLETNLDDVPGEVIGYCFDRLLAAGALDVFTVPIQMKKNRPGAMLCVMVPDAMRAEAEAILFSETGTLGIRRQRVRRRRRERRMTTVETPWGQVRGKLAGPAGGKVHFSPEFEDCARLARSSGIPLREVMDAAQHSFAANPPGPENGI